MTEILLYDEIGGTSSKEFRQQLDSVSGEDITLRINSVGGAVFEGLAMYSALKAYPGKVTAIVEGIAGSISSVIALAADEVIMAEGAFFMIHNPYSPAKGTASELKKTAGDLEKMQIKMLDIYSDATGLAKEELQALMDAETYFNAEESVAKGFASRVDGDADYSMAAVARLTNPPQAILAKLNQGKAVAMTDEEKAKMKALEEECAKLKAECEEMKKAKAEEEEESKAKAEGDDEAEAMDDEEEAKAEGDDEDEEAKASALATLLAVTGSKSFAKAEGALMALHAKAGSVAKSARAAEVDGLIKAGKLAPAQKQWALKASASALKSYKASLGDATVIPTHEHKAPASVEAPETESPVAASIRAQMGGK